MQKYLQYSTLASVIADPPILFLSEKENLKLAYFLVKKFVWVTVSDTICLGIHQKIYNLENPTFGME